MKLTQLVSFCFFLSLLAGCSSSSEVSPKLKVSNATIYAEPKANLNSAIAVDLVLVYDNDLLASIAKLPASTYFETSNQLRLDNPSLLDVWRWELVPGQVVNKFPIDSDKGRAFGGIVFANYLTPGDHRVKIPPSGEIKILLEENYLMSVADGTFDGLNVGKTASENVPNKTSTSTQQATQKLPCGNPLTASTSSDMDDEPGGFVVMQHQTIQMSPLEEALGKDRKELPQNHVPFEIKPSGENCRETKN